MLLQIAAGGALLALANTHASTEELAPMTVNGAMLAFDFGPDATLESVTESIRTMDRYVLGLIADSDEPAEIQALSQLKSTLAGVQRDAEREFVYMTRASNAEPIAVDAGSHLSDEQHASINDSSSSNHVDSNENEELKTDGKAQPQERSRPRKRS